jgi:aspartate racemase
VEIVPPDGAALDDVHAAYVAMAAAGVVTPAQREVFIKAGQDLMAMGAEAIMLGGTDLALAFDAAHAPFPLVDCAAIHVAAVARLAFG